MINIFNTDDFCLVCICASALLSDAAAHLHAVECNELYQAVLAGAER